MNKLRSGSITDREARLVRDHITDLYRGKAPIAVCIMAPNADIKATTLARKPRYADNARKRAWTARRTGLDTDNADRVFTALQRLKDHQWNLVDMEPGGVPLVDDVTDRLLGAIGVSGTGRNHYWADLGRRFFYNLRRGTK